MLLERKYHPVTFFRQSTDYGFGKEMTKESHGERERYNVDAADATTAVL